MAYTPSNKRAKNCCKRTIQVQVIIEDVVAVFFGTQCISDLLVFIHFTPQDKNFVSECTKLYIDQVPARIRSYIQPTALERRLHCSTRPTRCSSQLDQSVGRLIIHGLLARRCNSPSLYRPTRPATRWQRPKPYTVPLCPRIGNCGPPASYTFWCQTQERDWRGVHASKTNVPLFPLHLSPPILRYLPLLCRGLGSVDVVSHQRRWSFLRTKLCTTRSSAIAETAQCFVSLNISPLGHWRSFEVIPLSRACSILLKLWMYLVPFMSYSASNRRNLEIGVRGRSISLKIAPLESFGTVS